MIPFPELIIIIIIIDNTFHRWVALLSVHTINYRPVYDNTTEAFAMQNSTLSMTSSPRSRLQHRVSEIVGILGDASCHEVAQISLETFLEILGNTRLNVATRKNYQALPSLTASPGL